MLCDIFLRIAAFDPGGIRFFAQFNFFWQLFAFAVEIVKQKLSFPTKIHIHVDFAEKTFSFDSFEFLLHVALVSYLFKFLHLFCLLQQACRKIQSFIAVGTSPYSNLPEFLCFANLAGMVPAGCSLLCSSMFLSCGVLVEDPIWRKGLT